MEMNRWLALGIVIIMVLSSFAFVLLSGVNPSNQPGVNDPSDATIPPDATPIAFEAAGVDANVIEILPALRFYAETAEGSLIGALDAQINAIDGVRRVQSRFSQSEGAFGYVADVSFSSDRSAQEIADAIQALPAFSNNFTFLVYAIVQLPPSISLSSMNKDLNLSRDYSFLDNAVDALVSPQSRASDRIAVDVQVSLAGDQLRDQSVFESSNLSASPRFGEQTVSAKVVALEPRLSAVFDVPGASLSNQGLAESNLRALSGDINGVRLDFSSSDVVVELAVDANDLDQNTLWDLNQFAAFRSVSPVVVSTRPVFSAEISLAPETNIHELQSAWRKLLMRHGLEEKGAFRTRSVRGRLDLEFSRADFQTGGLAAQVLESLKTDLNAFGFEFRQAASLDLNAITDNGQTVSFSQAQLPVHALVQPGHAVGASVPIQIQYQIERDTIAFYAAQEN